MFAVVAKSFILVLYFDVLLGPIRGVWRRQRLIAARRQRGERMKDTGVYKERRAESERLRETGEIRLDGSRTEDDEIYEI